MKLLAPSFIILCFGFMQTSIFAADRSAEAVKVDAIFINSSKAHQTLTLTGTVEAKQHANLAPLQSGVIAQLFVEAGDIVVKGQKLMLIDTKLATLNLAQMEAQLAAAIALKNEAERLYQEVIALSNKQLVAETLLAERQSRFEIAKAELTRVKAEIAQQQEIVTRHTLYAPFAGVIANRNINVGEWVTQTTHAFTLVEQQQLRVKLAIPQEYLGQLYGEQLLGERVDKLDIEVTITPDFIHAEPIHDKPINTKSINVKLSRIVNVVNNISRTLVGLVDLPQNSSLVAGMSARAEIKLPKSEQAFVWLPKSAIKKHPDGGTSVFTVKNNKAHRLLVKILKQQANQVAVTGAPADQLYVLTGIELIKDGDLLHVTEMKGEIR